MSYPSYMSSILLTILISAALLLSYSLHFNPLQGSLENNIINSNVINNLTFNETTGVGFDLTLSYGTSAISFSNSTTVKIAKVKGDDTYRETMHRLSLYSSQHFHPPDDGMDEWLHDQPRQKLRKWRKSIGLPASEDVETVGNMVRVLKKRTEEYLGYRVPSALLTIPHIRALYDEDVRDAFEWVGIRYIAAPYVWDILRETSATYAVDGYGLCADPSDIDTCREEERQMPGESVLSVFLSRQVLFVGLAKQFSAKLLWEPWDQDVIEYSLGYENVETLTGKSKAAYWDAVTEALRRIMVRDPLTRRPDRILLQGDCAGQQDFLDVLESALDDLVDNAPGKITPHDKVFAAALGAAEFARRALLDEKHSNLTWAASGSNEMRTDVQSDL